MLTRGAAMLVAGMLGAIVGSFLGAGLVLPDRLILLLAATGAVPALLAGYSDPMLLSGPALGALLGFAMPWLASKAYLAWRGIEGLGAGDPKLLGAIGLWLGPLGVVATLLGGALVGLAAAAGLALAGKRVTARTALPLGSCLALAGFAVYLGQN
ncbi:MAG: hypothetical protein LC648_04995 [Novosphingobium sp.]|nr:hypothetical protein [Novosphingobium sp.]